MFAPFVTVSPSIYIANVLCAGGQGRHVHAVAEHRPVGLCSAALVHRSRLIHTIADLGWCELWPGRDAGAARAQGLLVFVRL